MKKKISVVTPCYNEEDNVAENYKRVKAVFDAYEQYDYEHIFIDNASEDRTVEILKEIAAEDKNVRVIVNVRNFGHIRSPYHGLLQAEGEAVVMLYADLQDPPEVIPEFIEKWEQGFKIVVGVKNESRESPLFFAIRKLYYTLINRLSEIQLIKNYNGFGLYDREVVKKLRELKDPYPYFRGLICELGYNKGRVNYLQQARKRGFTKNNMYTLYDIAMLGITSHSKIPLRLAAMLGFGLSMVSLLVAGIYFFYKILFWNSFSVGTAPVVIGLFFFSSVQLFFIGVIGEYIGVIHTHVLNRPLVIEKERVNFDG